MKIKQLNIFAVHLTYIAILIKLENQVTLCYNIYRRTVKYVLFVLIKKKRLLILQVNYPSSVICIE